MTPPAITFAGKGEQSTGHRRGLRKRPSPSSPRRVSGPAGGRAATPGRRAATATAGTATAPIARPKARPTGPRVRTGRPRRASARTRTTGSLPARAVAFVRALPDHPLLDRMIRGRAWIAMLGVMLVGIVAMQVEVLKLGASVGRSLQEGTTLQSRNQLLRASVASLADDQRIERLAARMGMVMPAPDAVVFLSPHTTADAQRATSNIHAPDPTTFLAALPPTGAAALGASGTAATTQATSTPATSTPATTTPTTTAATTTPSTGASTTATGAAAGAGAPSGTTTGGSAAGVGGASGAPVVGSPSAGTTPTAQTTPAATATGAVAIAPVGTGTTSSGG